MINNVFQTIDKLKDEAKVQTKISKIISRWKDVNISCGLYNYKNEIFTLSNIELEDKGFKAIVKIPDGMYLNDFKSKLPIIETNFSSVFLLDKSNRKKNSFTIKVLHYSVLDKNIKYKPITSINEVALKPYELYISNDLFGNPVIVNLKTKSHILLTGANGSGKSKMLDIMLTNLIYNHTKEDIQLYLIQLDKSDIIKYSLCNQCVGFGETLDEIHDLLLDILHLIKKRQKIIGAFQKLGVIDNYTEFNEMGKGYLPTVLIVFDEMASLMPKKNESDIIKQKKNTINSIVDQIAQFGRSLGIFGVFCLQRPTVDNLSSFVKSQSNNVISFRQNNSKSSEVATDNTELALNLENRFAIYLNGGSEPTYLKTPFFDVKEARKKYLLPRYDKFKYSKVLNEVDKIKESFKLSPIEQLYSQKELSKMQIVEHKSVKSKIKNFVPYQPVTEKDTVIVEESISTKNVSKPVFKRKIGGK